MPGLHWHTEQQPAELLLSLAAVVEFWDPATDSLCIPVTSIGVDEHTGHILLSANGPAARRWNEDRRLGMKLSPGTGETDDERLEALRSRLFGYPTTICGAAHYWDVKGLVMD